MNERTNMCIECECMTENLACIVVSVKYLHFGYAVLSHLLLCTKFFFLIFPSSSRSLSLSLFSFSFPCSIICSCLPLSQHVHIYFTFYFHITLFSIQCVCECVFPVNSNCFVSTSNCTSLCRFIRVMYLYLLDKNETRALYAFVSVLCMSVYGALCSNLYVCILRHLKILCVLSLPPPPPLLLLLSLLLNMLARAQRNET